MPVVTDFQKITVDGVGDVEVTDTQPHPDGGYVREFRIFGVAEQGSSGAPPLFVLRIQGDTIAAIDILAPARKF